MTPASKGSSIFFIQSAKVALTNPPVATQQRTFCYTSLALKSMVAMPQKTVQTQRDCNSRSSDQPYGDK